MGNTKKVYLFYLINDIIDISDFPAVQESTIMHSDMVDYSLYAYTDNKEYRDLFTDVRNMDMFKMKTVNMTNTQYENFSDVNPYYELCVNKFSTRCVDDYGVYYMGAVGLLSTISEHDLVFYNYSNLVEDQFIMLDQPNNIFYKLLERKVFSKELMSLFKDIFFSDILMEEIIRPIDELNPDGYNFDDLSIYIRTFGNTFRKDW